MTVMYLYYNQPQAISKFERLCYQYLDIDFLFIDDGSKIPLKVDWAKVVRIEDDVPWNQPRANNIGFSCLYEMNENETVLRMDIDHYFDVDDLLYLKDYIPEQKEIIKFKRNGLKSHPNIYLANVKDLINVGGYNEAFCGNYGYDDTEFMQRLRKRFFSFTEMDINVNINYNTGDHGLERDKSVNLQKYLKM